MKKIFSLFILFPLCLFSSNTLPNLEEMIQDFVIATRKLEIPGYPHAFNPSIIHWRGQLLLSFRIIPDRKQSFNAEIGLVFLNDDFSIRSEPQLLSLRDEYSSSPCRAEDARLVSIGDKLYMVYDDNVDRKVTKGGFRVFVAELHYDGEHFIPEPIECLNCFEGESRERREKAWVPFNYKGQLLLAYSLVPHLIFHPHLNGTGRCTTIANTTSAIDWNWGELRGGTPALLVNGQYLSFFHSSIEMETIHSEGKTMAHYFMGAYTFSPRPPFPITAISPEPIIGKNFYTGAKYKPYWKPVRCVFPCGYIHNDKYIWIVYGRDDHEAWVVTLDKVKFLRSLVKFNL